MDLNQKIEMRQGDMSGSPVGMVEGARQLKRLYLVSDEQYLGEVAVEYVWGEIPQAQSGYRRLVGLKAGGLALVGQIESGPTLPQVDDTLTNDEKARLQIERAEERRAEREREVESLDLAHQVVRRPYDA
jgi:hypothetical protein